MRSTKEVIGPARVRLDIEVPFVDLDPCLQPASGEHDLAGFRQGRLPFHVIDRRLGGTVLPAEVESALLTLVSAAEQEHEVTPLGRVDIQIVECGPARPLKLTAIVDVRPRIERPDLASLVVVLEPSTVDEPDEDRRLQRLRDDVLGRIAATVAEPEGVVRDEIEQRWQWMLAEFQRLGTSLTEYLAAAGTTEAQLDTDLRRVAAQKIRSQLVLDAVADEEGLGVTREEVGQAITRRARRAGIRADAYYDQLSGSGALEAIVADVRRAKALALVLRRVSIVDSEGGPVTLPAA